MLHSLRARLFAFVVALALTTALAVGAATYLSVHGEADTLFDYQLQQMALSLRDQNAIAEDERSALANPDLDFVVQVWSADGLALYSSRPQGLAAPLPARAVLGFSQIVLGGETWRIFAAATPLRVVQVGQPLGVRRRLAAAAAGRSVMPIALAAPLVAIGLWWLLGISLAPLQRVVDATRQRDAASLEPLPTAGLPTELKPLVDSFNGLLGRLAQAFETQQNFVADAAHELRTPLTALKLQLGLLRDAGTAAQREQALARLREGIERTVHLVEQLLALARAEHAHDPAAGAPRADFDLADTLRRVLVDVEPLLQARGAQLRSELPPPGQRWPVQGDARAWYALVRNLVDNALVHGGPGVRIAVSLCAAGRDALLRVDDSGPGIPPAERERVFDRFARRESTAAAGSGLGLAIVAAVARHHGAAVSLSTAEALGGLRAEVRWPAAAPDPVGTATA